MSAVGIDYNHPREIETAACPSTGMRLNLSRYVNGEVVATLESMGSPTHEVTLSDDACAQLAEWLQA